MPYLLDADVFISAWNGPYSFDTVPAFWDWLVAANGSGEVFSVRRIRDELVAQEDELAVWARDRDTGFFLPEDDEVISAVRHVATWARDQERLRPAAVAGFFNSGELLLIGHALAHGHVVVTQETASPNSEKILKVPDACAGVGVPSVNSYQMLRDAGARFVLG